MDAGTRKQRAMELVANAGQGNMAAVEALISEHFVLEQMIHDPENNTTSRGASYDRASYLGFLGMVKQMTRDGMNLTFDLALCEGDDVALFGSSEASAPSGRPYRNAYCWHLRFAGDRICLMREFFDTALGNRLLEG